MRAKTVVRIATAIMLVMSSAALAAPSCDVSEADIDKAGSYGGAVEEKVRAAKGCDAAFRVLEICQLGSSGDNALATIVQGKCEPAFIDKSAAKAAYEKAKAKCDKIAERNSGSMYQGFAAVCQARAARDFARGKGGRR
jgi:hypothetical protein